MKETRSLKKAKRRELEDTTRRRSGKVNKRKRIKKRREDKGEGE